MSNRLYTIQEVANILGVSTKTLRRWDQRGRFVPTRTAGNQRRYTWEQIQEIKTSSSAKATADKAKLKGISPVEPFFKPEVSPEKRPTLGLPSTLSGLPSGSFLKNHFLLKHFSAIEESISPSESKSKEKEAKPVEATRPGLAKLNLVKRGFAFGILTLFLSMAIAIVLVKYDIVAGLPRLTTELSQKKEQFVQFIANLPQINTSLKPKDLNFALQDNQAVLAAETGASDLVLNVNVPSFFSQSVGIGTTVPDSSAALDISAADKGFLAPRMTTVQRNAIVSPATGLFVYNTITNQYNMYDGTSWRAVGGITAVGDVTTGDAFTEGGIAGNSLWFHSTGGGVGKLTAGAISGTQTYTFPSSTGTLITTGNLTDITKVGTIGSGVWNGTAVTVTYGGTGATSLTGILLGNGTSPFTGLTTSAGIAGVITDETGTGVLVFNTNPVFDGNVTPTTTLTSDLGSSSLYWNNVYAANFIGASSGTAGYWQRNSSAISPINASDDVLIGSISTASAKFGFLNVATGTPTASVSAGAAGGVYLNATGTLATTTKQTLTLGDTDTGEVQLVPGGTLALTARGANLIGAGTLTGLTGLTSSGTITFSGFNANNNVPYATVATGVLAGVSTDTTGLCLVSGASVPSWIECPGGTGLTQWNIAEGAIYSGNTTLDLLLGGTSTASAKFAFINIAGGNPTASISGNLSLAVPTTAGANTFNLLNNSTLNFRRSPGGDAGLTTALYISNNGNIGIGTTAPAYPLDLLSTSATQLRFGYNTSNYFTTAISSQGSVTFNSIGTDPGGGQSFSFADNVYVTSGGLFLGTQSSTNGSLTLYSSGGATAPSISADSSRNLNLSAPSGQIVLNGTGDIVLDPSTSNLVANLSSTGDFLIQSAGTAYAIFTDTRLVGIGTTSPLASLDVRPNLVNGGTIAIASASGSTSFAGLLVDNTGTGDLFTASKSGATKFVILNNGNLQFAGTTNFLTTLASAATAAQTITFPDATGTLCLQNSAACGFAMGDTTNWWTQAGGALYPINSTLDFLIGGTSTAAAKFAFINVDSGNPTASISGNLSLAVPTTAGANTFNLLNNSTLNFQRSPGGDASLTSTLFLANNGNVGIGTTNPLTALDVRGNLGTIAAASISAQSSFASLIVDNRGIGDLFTASKSGATKFVITNAGNVGIGTTSPTSRLDVNGDIVVRGQWGGLGWRQFYDGSTASIRAMAVYNNKLYVGVGDAAGDSDVLVFDGSTWSTSYNGTESYIVSLAVYNGKLYAGKGGITDGDGDVLVFNGTTWSTSYSGSFGAIYSLAVYNGKLYAGQGCGMICTSGTDDIFVFDGTTWSTSYNGSLANISALAVYNGKLYAGERGVSNGDGDVFVFDGSTWSTSYSGSAEEILSLAVYNGKLYAGQGGDASAGEGDIFSFDGSAWSTSRNGSQEKIDSLVVYNGKLYAGQGSESGDGDVLMFDGSAWSTSYNGTQERIQSVAVYNGKLYAGQGYGSGDGDVYVLEDNLGSQLAFLQSKLNYFTWPQTASSTQDELDYYRLNLSSGLSVLGNLGVGTSSALFALDVRGSLGTVATASISAQSSFATLVVDNAGTGDLFTASKSGATKFVILNNGNLQFAGTTNFLTTLASAATAAQTITFPDATGTLCLQNSAACGFAMGDTTNWWTQAGGALYPINSTLDFLIGGTSTAAAKFAFINIAGGSPTATISGNLSLAVPTTAGANTFNLLNNSTLNFQRSPGGDAGLAANSVLFLNNNGYVGIGTTVPGSLLTLANDGWLSGISTSSGVTNMFKLNTADQIQVGAALNIDGSYVFPTDGGIITAMDMPFSTTGTNAYVFRIGTSNVMSIYGESNATGIASNLRVGIGTIAPLATFDVRGLSGTTPVASISGQTSFAAMLVDNSGIGDLFTASKSGAPKFVITNAGNVGIGTTAPSALLSVGSTSQFQVDSTGAIAAATGITSSGSITFSDLNTSMGILYMNGTGGLLAQTAQGAANTLLHGNGTSAPTFSKVDLTADVSGILPTANGGSFWNSSSGALYPGNTTMDLLLGATSTASAKFGFINIAGGNPTATISSNLSLAVPTGSAYAATFNLLNNGTLNFQRSPGGDADLTSVLFLGNNGNVGIGTTAPTSTLSIGGTGSSTISNNSGNLTITPAANLIISSGSVGIGTTTPLATLDIRPNLTNGGTIAIASASGSTSFAGLLADNTGTGDLFTASKSGATKFVITNAGFVGIGTTAPSALLSVGSTSQFQVDSAGAITAPTSSNTINSLIINAGALSAVTTLSMNNQLTNSYANSAAINLTGNAAGITFTGTGVDQIITAASQNLALMPGGFVGIGTTAPLLKLDVWDSQSASAAAQIYNTSDGLDADGLVIKLGNPSSSAVDPANHFISFETFGIGIVGSVQGTGAQGVTYATNGIADFAEYFKKDRNTSIPFGSVVCFDDKGLAVACDNNSNKIIGVASEHPAFLGGENRGDESVAVGLVGQVKTRVSTANGEIKIGDPLTTSGIAGVAVKATSVGQILGKAIEVFNGQGEGNILASVNITWYNPSIYVSYDGTLAGMAATVDSIGNQLASQGQALQSWQASSSAQIDYVLETDPLFMQSQDKIAQLQSGMDLLSQKVEQTASISAFLMDIVSSQVLGASTSAVLDLGDVELNSATVSEDLMVLGRTTVTDLGVTGNINAGLLAIHGLDGEINTLAGDLYLQKQGIGGVDILNGKVVIDTAGNMTVAGTITADEIEANNYTVLGDQSIGSASISAGLTFVEVLTPIATSDSKIFLTATSLTDKQLTVVKKLAGKFRVAIPIPTTTPITFDWWIISHD